MFWEAVEHLHCWERKNLPGAETPQGVEVLIWVLKHKDSPKPLKNLYRSSRFSEPTLRASMKSLVKTGAVVLESNGSDLRNRYARATRILEDRIHLYRELFKELSVLAEREGIAVATKGSQIDLLLPARPDDTKSCLS